MLRRWVLAAMVLFFASAGAAQAGDVNGLWADVAGPDFRNGALVLAQDGNEIHMAHYLEYKGTPMVEHGRGSFKDGKIVLKVKVSKPIPGWATTGIHTLQLSEDGNTLKGEYTDSHGNKGPLEFRRAQPAE